MAIPPRLEPIVREGMNQNQTISLIAAAFNLADRGTPRFSAAGCIVTSDAFVMATFTGRDGVTHNGAFVGAWDDLKSNIDRFVDHFSLTPEEETSLRSAINGWVTQDYSGRARL